MMYHDSKMNIDHSLHGLSAIPKPMTMMWKIQNHDILNMKYVDYNPIHHDYSYLMLYNI